MSTVADDRFSPRTHAAATPGKPAAILAGGGAQIGYAELERRANRIAHVLRGAGLARVQHVAFLLDNGLPFFEVAWACQRLGVYYTPINSRLKPDEVAYIVEDCGARVVIVSAVFPEVAARLAALPLRRFSVGGALPGFEPLEAAADARPDTPVAAEGESVAMLYSSGTTGRPKGVKLPLTERSFGTLDAFGPFITEQYGFTADTVYLCTQPLYHGAGLYYALLMQRLGATVVLMPKFEPRAMLQAVERHRITHTQVVPTMFVRLRKLPPAVRSAHDLSSLQVVIHGAAPCPVAVKDEMLRWWGPIIWEYFGATEGNGYCLIGPDEWLAHRGSVGRPLYGRVHVLDEAGQELPAGADGLVYFSGTTPFEYHNDGAKTGDSRSPQGWTTTGDIGHVDAEGYLYLTDRKAFTIISGGVNIYPQEVENVLVGHSKVLDAAVFGVPDAEFGEAVHAVVQLVDGTDTEAGEALAQELVTHCRERLAHYKCPKRVEFIAELPRHDNGKLYKRLLRDAHWPSQP